MPDFIKKNARAMHILDNNSLFSNEMIELGVGYEVCRGIKSIWIGDHQYCTQTLKELTMMDFPRLKSVDIGKWCFTSVRQLVICHCPEMESLSIGYGSFATANKAEEITGTDGIVQIHHCSQLQSIKLEDYVFYDYHHFEIKGILI